MSQTILYRGREVTCDEFVNARVRETGRRDQESLDDFAQDFGERWAAEGEAPLPYDPVAAATQRPAQPDGA